MPKRNDIKSILIIGAGPIIIGQACEFDYSGAQACKALKEEGYRVILVNSNPATIMTDPNLADATYVEPITPEMVEKIIAKERPDALLPTMGGQTALNCALSLHERGTLKKYNVQLIGAQPDVIDKAENRARFNEAMANIGLEVPRNAVVETLDAAKEFLKECGLPAIIRPSFTLGGTGGGVAYSEEEFEEIVLSGLDASPTNQVLIDESLLGWKEYEMEVVRDRADNCIIICSIENVDPMGVHTGDSITVAPALTLTDKEYQIMRDASLAVLREIGVETGGSNVQFGVNPKDGRMVVIEMNPRVSRSSALASKATGFPIAKVAAKLAIGYTLDEIANDIVSSGQGSESRIQNSGARSGDRASPERAEAPLHREDSSPNGEQSKNWMPASFEPSIDYVVTKIPRFTFEKFAGADPILTSAMKSVGEVMALGGNFKESLQKALRSLETGLNGLNDKPEKNLKAELAKLTPKRILLIAQAFREGWSLKQVQDVTSWDPWFLEQIQEIVAMEAVVPEIVESLLPPGGGVAEERVQRTDAVGGRAKTPPPESLRDSDSPIKGELALLTLKQAGFSDARLAQLAGKKEAEVTSLREALGIFPVYKRVDTCAAEFAADTPYMYSTYAGTQLPPGGGVAEAQRADAVGGQPSRNGTPPHDSASDDASSAPPPGGSYGGCESNPTNREKIIILGSGPNRIGQGIEFDYTCVHAAFALKDAGYETVMVNCNPETVSTDYDTSDRLYFEPLTAEDVIALVRKEMENGTVKGIIVQFGGQTPLKLARALEEAGLPIIGTSPKAIDEAEDREQFIALLNRLHLRQPVNDVVFNRHEAAVKAEAVGYPLVVRPSFVLGGRAMAVLDNPKGLETYLKEFPECFDGGPLLLDSFLKKAIEVDVDCICDGQDVFIAGVMQHIEEAGVHSGDSACSIPPYSLDDVIVEELKRQTKEMALALGVSGLMNVQFAVKDNEIFVLEVNPRASRTVPFVAKATGVPVAKIAARVMAGEKLRDLLPTRGGVEEPIAKHGDSVGGQKQTPPPETANAFSDSPIKGELTSWPLPPQKHYAVKEVVFPFSRFGNVDVVLGPEMKSTGEVMGIDENFQQAFAKAQMGAGMILPENGTVFISVKNDDKPTMLPIARMLLEMGFDLVATGGTQSYFEENGIHCVRINKVLEGSPHVVDALKEGKIVFVINTTHGEQSLKDSFSIRRTALVEKIPYVTTGTGAYELVKSLKAIRQSGGLEVRPLQDFFAT